MTAEPRLLLAVVEDPETRRRWFRWSYDAHTSQPWQMMGAVHVRDEEPACSRWEDLPPVQVVSEGVAECGCASCSG